MVKNSFTCSWVLIHGFHPLSCPLYLECHGGVWNPQGSSHICISVKRDLFRWPACDRKSPPQRRTTLDIFGKEADLGGKLFHKQSVYRQKSINIQQSFLLGRRITLYPEVLINVNRNLQKAVYKKEGYTKSANEIRVRYKEIIIKSMR